MLFIQGEVFFLLTAGLVGFISGGLLIPADFKRLGLDRLGYAPTLLLTISIVEKGKSHYNSNSIMASILIEKALISLTITFIVMYCSGFIVYSLIHFTIGGFQIMYVLLMKK